MKQLYMRPPVVVNAHPENQTTFSKVPIIPGGLLIWMFHSRGVNNQVNYLHERSLRIVCKDNISSFDNLL